ncbi:MAG TPA: tetratricopeptide repeat protein [Fibrobacteraceae bacterium]|nr:tetratricopeptide repeat protein [Fibrobacteraceae bacterium]
MSFPLFGFLCCLLFSVPSFASNWSAGDKAFTKGDYAKALDLYYKARSDAPDDRRLNLNIGTTLYKLKRYDEAKTELGQAVYSADTTVAKHAAFNLADVQYRVGQAAQKPAERVAAWRESIALLKKAVDFDPGYDNAKRNAEFVQRKLKEELDKQKQQQDQNNQQNQKQPELSAAAKQALARALQLCHQGLYKDAQAVLEQTVQADSTASRLNAYVQRMEDLVDISEGREPSRQMDASNTDQDLGVI